MRATITDAGRALLDRLELGEISMEISSVKTGSGLYTPTESIAGATALKSPKNTYTASSTSDTADGIAAKYIISNVDGQGQSIVSTSYNVNEFGVYVTVDDGETQTQALYVIAVADNDSGYTLPAYTGSNPIEFVETFNLTFSSTSNVTINSSGAAALATDLEAHENSVVTDTNGAHGLRIHNDTLEYNNNGSWEEVPAGTKIIQIPTASTTSFTYDGTEKELTLTNYDPDLMTMTGASATNVGTYTATFTLKNTRSCVWSDMTNAPKTISWSIEAISVNIPTVTGSFTYDGTEKTATVGTYDTTLITQGGNTSGTNAGTYGVTFSLIDSANYKWSDNTTTTQTVNWTIAKAPISSVANLTSYTYGGTPSTPTVSSNPGGAAVSYYGRATEDGEGVSWSTVTGTTFNAGTRYIYAVIAESDNYQGLTTANSAFSISKANGSITPAQSSVALTTSTLYADVSIPHTGDGTFTVASADTSTATVTHQSGDTYRVTAEAHGTTTINITLADGTNYNGTTASISVSCDLAYATLKDNSWDTISKVSAAGNASSKWSVGATKSITISGTVGTKSISGTYWVYILGFDHNSSVEGNGISFGGFKTAQTSGIDVCLCDDHYNSSAYSGEKWFNLNHWGQNSGNYNTNYGGWAACDARYDILGSTNQAPNPYGSIKTTGATGQNPTSTCATSPVANTLMAALPSDLRAVMKPITKYTDNTGNSSNSAANVTATTDYLPLLAEFEIHGARSYANEYEKNYQRQYAYYANGNSKVKYQHGSTSSAAYWWCRSAYSSDAITFCFANTGGSASGYYSRYSGGLAPAFLV